MKQSISLLALTSVFGIIGIFGSVSKAQTWTEVATGSPNEFVFQAKVDGSQAAEFVEPNRLFEKWDALLVNNALIKSETKRIYHENGCTVDGKYEETELADSFCGMLNSPDEYSTVQWSFGRGGWAGAGAEYHSFLGFTTAGTGRFTTMAMGLDYSVEVNAISEIDETGVVFEYRLKLLRMRLFDENGVENRIVSF